MPAGAPSRYRERERESVREGEGSQGGLEAHPDVSRGAAGPLRLLLTRQSWVGRVSGWALRRTEARAHTDCAGVFFGREFGGQGDLRRNWDHRILSGERDVSGRRGWRGASCRAKSGNVCGGVYLVVVHFVRWLGTGTGFLKTIKTCAAFGGTGMGSLRECGWLLLMLISNAYLYKFPRRAVSRSTRLGIEKDSAASKAGAEGQGIWTYDYDS